MRVLAAILLCCCLLPAFSATYYVSTTNAAASDSNDGSSGSPWKTIGKAASTAVAGDTVIVKAGTYNESVTVGASGSAGSPITFAGERSGSDWLTIIDPSTEFTNGWVSADDIGSGVWKLTEVASQAVVAHLGNKRLAAVFTMGDLDVYDTSTWTNAATLGLTTGTNVLAMATNLTLYTGMSPSHAVYSWDGVEAMFGCVSNAGAGNWTTYLRLRDQSDPNGLSFRAGTASLTGVSLNQRSYITLSNLWIRNAPIGIFMSDAACNENIIVSNRITGGATGISLQSGCYSNTIRGNDIWGAYYGYTNAGAWGITNGTPSNYVYSVRNNLYCVSKFLMGESETDYDGVNCMYAGNGNVVDLNHVYQSIGVGLGVYNYPGYTTNTIIRSNTIEGMVSVGITLSPGGVGTHVTDNLISDCNSGVRVHNLGYPGDSNRLAYIYQNRFWCPTNAGNHIFTHTGVSADDTNEHATVWIYNNSFSGGNSMLEDNGEADDIGGIPGFRILNNICSGANYYVSQNSIGEQMWTNAAMWGAFDYNLIAPIAPVWNVPSPIIGAWGSHNLTNATPIWTHYSGMPFTLPAGSSAISAALDVSQPFTLNDVEYPALPMDSQTKVGAEWDMGAFEYTPATTFTHTHGSGSLGTSTR